MDLVKSHLMYAVGEEVEMLKEQMGELVGNSLLKTLASLEQLEKFQAHLSLEESVPKSP
ncbi:TSC22 domain family protein 3-like [Canis lupus familiaris]|uniref:TSC22 domain family protein 3-like n=1 Tax=Canis lupus dingo TaxID=286419 RepID=UPI0015F154CD|nr:TSC22 domain family protein 3-like [Canis lupus dingo]XP_038305026.1 TSC22 domain family protein 3-like [Canis lupus familiaris]XP_038442554.1 TSC22 domain family protein 3-like [Canis lupus familiaris]